jgi:hypothetical protein
MALDGRLKRVRYETHGSRDYLRLDVAEVEAYAATHGPVGRERHADGQLLAEVEALRAEVAALRALLEDRPAGSGSHGLGGEVVALREALQLQRAALGLLQEADEERSRATGLLMDAMRSFEQADTKRRQATAALDRVVGAMTLPRDVNGAE